MNLGYVRVSTVEQNEARQVEALNALGVEKFYTEKISGKDMNRPALEMMIEWARKGDTVYVHEYSRLSRSVSDLLKIIERLQAKGVRLVSNKERLDTSTPDGKLMLTVIGAINEFERAIMLERQREGIAIAKRDGKYKGRKGTRLADLAGMYDAWLRREKTKAELARESGVSRPTLDRLFREYEKEHIAKVPTD